MTQWIQGTQGTVAKSLGPFSKSLWVCKCSLNILSEIVWVLAYWRSIESLAAMLRSILLPYLKRYVILMLTISGG